MPHCLNRCGLARCLAVALSAGFGDRLAAQPVNDECAAATTLTAATPRSFDTTAATISAEHWRCAEDFGVVPGLGGDVWFRYTAAIAGLARFSICIPPNDAGVAAFVTVYSACGDGGDELACDPAGDPFFSGTCSITVVAAPVAAGRSVLVRIAGYDNTFFTDPIPAVGTISVEVIPPPPNDTCAGALPVGEGIFEGNNSASAVDASGASCADTASDVWFRYTATISGPVEFDTRLTGFGPTFSPFYGGVISVFDACAGAELGCGSTVTITAVAGHTYLARVATTVGMGATGPFTLRIVPPFPSGSAQCSAPRGVGIGTFPFSILEAPADPLACGDSNRGPAHNIWFRYTAAATGTVQIDVTGADFFPSLGASADCAGASCASASRIILDTVVGGSYLIRVGSAPFTEAGGWGTLRIQAIAIPTNDTCGAPITLVQGTPQPFSTLGATTVAGPACGNDASGGIKDIWYRYVATAPGVAVFGTGSGFTGGGPGLNFGVTLSVYNACGAAPIACATNQQGSCINCVGAMLSVPVSSGQVVLVRVAGTPGFYPDSPLPTSGEGTLSVTLAQPPANDLRAAATPLVIGANPFSTTGARTDGLSTCETPSGFTANDVWFSYTAPTNRLASLVLCADFSESGLSSAVLSVIDGVSNQEVACARAFFRTINGTSCNGRTDAIFNAVAGRRYLVRVAGEGGASGSGTLTLSTSDFLASCLTRPAGAFDEPEACGVDTNYGCRGRSPTDPAAYQDLPSANITVWGSSRADNASRDLDWYRFTLTSPSAVTIELSAEFPAILFLMRDSCPFSDLTFERTLERCGPPARITQQLPAGRWGLLVAHDPNNQVDPNGLFFDLPCSIPNHYLLSIASRSLGACCGPSGCTLATAGDCAAQTGRFSGEGTVCPSASYAMATAAGAYEDISAGNTPLALANNSGRVVNLGFTFEFFGRRYTSAGVSDNGYLAFGNQPLGVADNPNDLSIVEPPANAIFALWDDFNPANGMIFTRADGAPGARRFTASWQNMAGAGFNQDTDSFQVVLFEGSNRIELRYGPLSNRSIFPGDVTVGLKDLQGFSILQVPSAQFFPATGAGLRSLTFTPTPTTGVCSNNPCRGDFNDDNAANVQDVFDYLICYFSGPPCLNADRNGNGTVTVQDLLDFLVDWFRGC